MSAPFYRVGTITLTEDSAVVTGALTGWGNPAYARPGDLLCRKDPATGVLVPVGEIASVESNTSLTLVDTWLGATLEDIAYAIMPSALVRNSIADLNYTIATFTQNLPLLTSGEGVPSDEFGSDGWYYFREDAPEYYRKVSGSWGSPVSLTGPPGPAGPSYQATSVSSVAIGTGAKTFHLEETGRGFTVGQWVRASHDAANYVEGPVASYSSDDLVIDVPAGRAVGTGTFATWNVNITGAPGPVNSLAIGTVNASAPGSAAAASITGSAPSQTLNLTLPRGATGPANSLAIGTVTEGPAGASITGDAPAQTLNLVLPKGDAATVAVGDVTTGEPGSSAAVTNTGTSGAAVLAFTIPRGASGATGPAGPNTGLDYAWDTGAADSDPGDGDIRVDQATWSAATYVFISKTGRNGEALAAVISALCGASNPHKAHLRMFPVASPAIHFEAEVQGTLIDGGNYWKIPVTVTAASAAQPSASAVMCVALTRSGEAASPAANAVIHAMLGGL